MRFTLIFLGTLGLLVGVVGAVNYVVNPYGVYPPRWFVPASANELETALRKLEDPTLNPDVAVFGSSRTWVLLESDIDCYSGLVSGNYAYNSATPQGYFALASYMVEHKPAPKLLVVGVDVEAFEGEAQFGDKLRAVPRLQQYLQNGTRLTSWWLDTTNLFSLAQLNDAARVVQTQVVPTPSPTLALNPDKKQAAKIAKQQNNTAAGQPITQPTPKQTKEPIPAAIQNANERSAKRMIRTYLQRFDKFEALSAEEQDYFEKLLQLAQAHNMRVKLFISTLHPRLIAALNKQGYYPKRKAEVMRWLQGLQATYGFELYDFSTPDTFGGNLTDFFNLAHISGTNRARLIGAMFTEQGRAAKCAPR